MKIIEQHGDKKLTNESSPLSFNFANQGECTIRSADGPATLGYDVLAQ